MKFQSTSLIKFKFVESVCCSISIKYCFFFFEEKMNRNLKLCSILVIVAIIIGEFLVFEILNVRINVEKR